MMQLPAAVLMLWAAGSGTIRDCAAAEVAPAELADEDHSADFALQTEMMGYFCEQYPGSPICHKLEHERELHEGDTVEHWHLPVQHLQEDEDDEVHRVYCAEGAPGRTGNPKLCDEYEERRAARLRDKILKEQVRHEPA